MAVGVPNGAGGVFRGHGGPGCLGARVRRRRRGVWGGGGEVSGDRQAGGRVCRPARRETGGGKATQRHSLGAPGAALPFHPTPDPTPGGGAGPVAGRSARRVHRRGLQACKCRQEPPDAPKSAMPPAAPTGVALPLHPTPRRPNARAPNARPNAHDTASSDSARDVDMGSWGCPETPRGAPPPGTSSPPPWSTQRQKWPVPPNAQHPTPKARDASGDA